MGVLWFRACVGLVEVRLLKRWWLKKTQPGLCDRKARVRLGPQLGTAEASIGALVGSLVQHCASPCKLTQTGMMLRVRAPP